MTQQERSSAHCHQQPCKCNMQAHQKEDGHYDTNNTVRYIQSDRHMGQHRIEGATAASEGKSLLMTHTTHNVVISWLHCLNHFPAVQP